METYTSNLSSFSEILRNAQSSDGKDLLALSYEKPVMLVFLRHFGCTFCREVLRDLGKIREEIEEKGIQLVLAHMSAPDYAEQMLEKFKLAGIPHISNPDKKLYEEFGLRQGSMKQLFGWRMWVRGFQAGVIEGLGIGTQQGDGFMMPGYFLLHQGTVIGEYIPKDAADHPDYLKLAGDTMSCFACE